MRCYFQWPGGPRLLDPCPKCKHGCHVCELPAGHSGPHVDHYGCSEGNAPSGAPKDSP